ncbi:MAG: hypothetical protein RR139_03900 [Lachnospiraceae bacterium]
MKQEQINKIETEVMEVSSLLYCNKDQEAYERVGNIITSLQQICMELIQLAQKNQELQEMKLDVIAVNTLKQLVECYKWQDILGLADCLRYEMSELIHINVQLVG